nr:MAG TPA: hypothetical protein [Caudoviricetes sp.]
MLNSWVYSYIFYELYNLIIFYLYTIIIGSKNPYYPLFLIFFYKTYYLKFRLMEIL